MREVAIRNITRPLSRRLQAGYCATFRCRLRGLTFRREMPPDWGLLLVQPQESRLGAAIHMWGVGMDLVIVWINEDQCVVDKRYARRWRSLIVPKCPARYVLEIHPKRWDDFQVGDEVLFEIPPVD